LALNLTVFKNVYTQLLTWISAAHICVRFKRKSYYCFSNSVFIPKGRTKYTKLREIRGSDAHGKLFADNV